MCHSPPPSHDLRCGVAKLRLRDSRDRGCTPGAEPCQYLISDRTAIPPRDLKCCPATSFSQMRTSEAAPVLLPTGLAACCRIVSSHRFAMHSPAHSRTWRCSPDCCDDIEPDRPRGTVAAIATEGLIDFWMGDSPEVLAARMFRRITATDSCRRAGVIAVSFES